MGESRDAVKAASEIGRDHDGKVCPEQAIDISVIAVTFRGATPGVMARDGCAFGSPQFLGATANSRRSADLPTFPARGRVVLSPDRRPCVFAKPFGANKASASRALYPVADAPVSAVQRAWTKKRDRGGLPRAVGS